MGQDIMFTRTSIQHQAPDYESEEWDDLMVDGSYAIVFPQCQRITPWNCPDVDPALLNSAGVAVFTATYVDQPFIGTSYGAWSDFREALAGFFGATTTSELVNNPDNYLGRVPLFNLIAHVFTEAQLTPSAVRLLASDFRMVANTTISPGRTQESAFFDSLSGYDKDHFIQMYNDLRDSVLATAQVGGMVVFG